MTVNLDLIPLRHFFDLYRYSSILTVYFYGSSVCTSVISGLLTFKLRRQNTEFDV
jgi:uncharacterized membrane protein YciS (DUF1049 family)